jgi:molecular chaperone Hsp33
MKKKKTYGSSAKDKLLASINDKLYTFILEKGSIRGVVLNGTRMVNEMRWNHELGILETLMLGHGYLATALMSANLKGNDRVKLQIECSGPVKGMIVEANAFGEIRGFLKQVPIPIDRPPKDFNLSPYFGAGFLSVTRILEDGKHPFTGKVMMENGSVAKDLTLYHYQSEQIPTAYALSITFDRDGEVTGAGGLFLQVLPGAQEKILDELEEKISKMPSLGDVVNNEAFPDQWLIAQLGQFQPKLLDRRGIEFMCHCSRHNVGRMLTMLSRDELEDMAQHGPFPVQIRCHHCNTLYDFNQKQLEKIYNQRLTQ